ncbi:MAG TPA: heparin lyase I family protein [Burkholderiales bacterium]|jgi:hypothetical protein
MFEGIVAAISLLAAAVAAAAGGGATPAPGDGTLSLVGSNITAHRKFSCTFARAPTDCGFRVQEKARGRASIVNMGRDGGTALRLQTRPGDQNVASSGKMERTDVYLSQEDTGCYEGREQVWEHSVLFPDDFAMPTWQMYVIFDFHNSAPGPGQANFHVNLGGRGNENGDLIFRGYGGAKNPGGEFRATIGKPRKNVWYDFVYHVRWSSRGDGFFRAWVNGVMKLEHRGPTLYAGQGCYLKLANYHTPVCDPYPGCTGPASSVIHDRVIRYDVLAK